MLAAGIGAYSQARVELMAGDLEAASATLRASYDALTAMDERYYRPCAAAVLAKSLFALGQRDEAEELANVAAALASPDDIEAQALLAPVKARLLAARGQTDEARALADSVRALLARTDAPVLRADALVELAEAASDTAEREQLLEDARALYASKQHLLGVAEAERRLGAARALVG